MTEREAIEWLKGCVVAYEVDSKGKPNGNVTCELIQEVIDMAISALEKQEQSNTQSVNSTHTSRPNALESLNLLERAKDNKGCVPMSLVRQAFRNVMEQAVDKSVQNM